MPEQTASDAGGPVYNINDKLPPSTLILTILQHFFALAVHITYPVIISGAVCGSEDVTTTLISATLAGCGIATVLQAFRRIGSGHVLPIIPNSSYLPASLLAATGGGLPMLYGMLIAGGLIEMIISRFTRFFRFIFPTEVCGTVLFLLGIAIVPFAFPLFLGSTDSSPLDPASAVVGVITLASMIILSVIKKRIFKFYSTLIGIIIGFIAAAALGVFKLESFTEISSLTLFAVPEFAFLTGYDFSPALLAPFIIAVICIVMKTAGNITLLNSYTGNTDKKIPSERSVCRRSRSSHLRSSWRYWNRHIIECGRSCGKQRCCIPQGWIRFRDSFNHLRVHAVFRLAVSPDSKTDIRCCSDLCSCVCDDERHFQYCITGS